MNVYTHIYCYILNDIKRHYRIYCISFSTTYPDTLCWYLSLAGRGTSAGRCISCACIRYDINVRLQS